MTSSVRRFPCFTFWPLLYLPLGAVDVKLSEEEVKELEQSYQPQAAFGHS